MPSASVEVVIVISLSVTSCAVSVRPFTLNVLVIDVNLAPSIKISASCALILVPASMPALSSGLPAIANAFLKSMIASDPETVTSSFTKLSTNLYDDLTKKMAGTTLSSAMTVYNDKQMKTEYDDYL